MKNQPGLLAALISAALLTGCATGGGDAEGPAPDTEPRTRIVWSDCGFYAIFDIYGDCSPTYEERITKKFTSWAGVKAKAGFLYQYDTVGETLEYQHKSGIPVPGTFWIGTRDYTDIPEYNANGTVVVNSWGYNVTGTRNLAPIGHSWMDDTSYDSNSLLLAANPFALGWDYQSFGIWYSKETSRATAAVRSYGAATPAAAVPAAGAATFTGKLAGFYVPPTGPVATAIADLTVSANFSARTLNFASTGTTVTLDRGTATAAPNLNLNGSLSYLPGSSSFNGKLTNSAGTMSGSSKGQFYGPAAQELGGVFTVKSPTTVETFTGGYGAKR